MGFFHICFSVHGDVMHCDDLASRCVMNAIFFCFLFFLFLTVGCFNFDSFKVLGVDLNVLHS